MFYYVIQCFIQRKAPGQNKPNTGLGIRVRLELGLGLELELGLGLGIRVNVRSEFKRLLLRQKIYRTTR